MFYLYCIEIFSVNLIDHAVDLKRSVRDPRKHWAIDHLSSHADIISRESSFPRGLRLRLYLILFVL